MYCARISVCIVLLIIKIENDKGIQRFSVKTITNFSKWSIWICIKKEKEEKKMCVVLLVRGSKCKKVFFFFA